MQDTVQDSVQDPTFDAAIICITPPLHVPLGMQETWESASKKAIILERQAGHVTEDAFIQGGFSLVLP